MRGDRHLAAVEADQDPEQPAVRPDHRRYVIATHPQLEMLGGVGGGMPRCDSGGRRGSTVEHAGGETVRAWTVGPLVETGEGSRHTEIARSRRRYHDETGCLHPVQGANGPQRGIDGAPRLF
jgi:hypothetical protein